MGPLAALALGGFFCIWFAIMADEDGDEKATKEFESAMGCSPMLFILAMAILGVCYMAIAFVGMIIPH